MNKVWVLAEISTVDGILDNSIQLFHDKSEALAEFHRKAEQDYTCIKSRRNPSEIHVNSEQDYDTFDDGDHIIEYHECDYCSWEHGYGFTTTVGYTLREQEIK